jgi:hypothetical protein
MRVTLLAPMLMTEGSFQSFEAFYITRLFFQEQFRQKRFDPGHVVSREVDPSKFRCLVAR